MLICEQRAAEGDEAPEVHAGSKLLNFIKQRPCSTQDFKAQFRKVFKLKIAKNGKKEPAMHQSPVTFPFSPGDAVSTALSRLPLDDEPVHRSEVSTSMLPHRERDSPEPE